MRHFPVLVFLLAVPLSAAESHYPLWDNHESVADYAKRVNLPPTRTLALGDNVKMELVLIPAGKFMMGTPEPTPVDEEAFLKKIIIGKALLASSVGALLVMLIAVSILSVRTRQRPKFSLLRLLMITIAAGGCVLSGLHWQQAANDLRAAQLEYSAAEARFRVANNNEKPAHPVTFSVPFYMGTYDVTQAQYQAVNGTNPSQFNGKDNPVENVSWDDAQAFCEKLTERTKQTVRLPSEVEWEYSCRAGTTTAYNSGDTESDLGRVAWYNGNSKNTTHPVGQKEANAFGLYDMHGNVWQWCQDSICDMSHVRGGSWINLSISCRSATRSLRDQNYRGYFIGFRVVVPAISEPWPATGGARIALSLPKGSTRNSVQGQRPAAIPAWGNAPGKCPVTHLGLKARPIAVKTAVMFSANFNGSIRIDSGASIFRNVNL